MTSLYWALWLAFTVINAALFVAAWRLSTEAREILARAQAIHAEADEILTDAHGHLATAKRIRGAF